MDHHNVVTSMTLRPTRTTRRSLCAGGWGGHGGGCSDASDTAIFPSCAVTAMLGIVLRDEHTVVLGRNSTTGLQDLRCSRRQATAKANFSRASVQVRHLGLRAGLMIRTLRNQNTDYGDVAAAATSTATTPSCIFSNESNDNISADTTANIASVTTTTGDLNATAKCTTTRSNDATATDSRSQILFKQNEMILLSAGQRCELTHGDTLCLLADAKETTSFMLDVCWGTKTSIAGVVTDGENGSSRNLVPDNSSGPRFDAMCAPAVVPRGEPLPASSSRFASEVAATSMTTTCQPAVMSPEFSPSQNSTDTAAVTTTTAATTTAAAAAPDASAAATTTAAASEPEVSGHGAEATAFTIDIPPADETISKSWSGIPDANSWRSGLESIARAPERHRDVVVLATPTVLGIKDKYPKSRHHWLIVPRKPICDIFALSRAHLQLLTQMKQAADELVSRVTTRVTMTTSDISPSQEVTTAATSTGPQANFSIGFHAVPSMSQVHLHVISHDFDSPWLKTKKHWNSFTTPFLLDYTKVRNAIESSGRVVKDKPAADALLKRPLACHICGQISKNMPHLKAHIRDCATV